LLPRSFFHLHQQLAAVGDHVLDLGVANRDAFLEVVLRDLLERQEAMAVFAVIDEAGFERRLDARHHRLVDVALALFASFDLGFEIDQFLAIDDRQATLFGLRRIDQHALHGVSIHRSSQRRCTRSADPTKEPPWTAAALGSLYRSEVSAAAALARACRPGRSAVRAWPTGPRALRVRAGCKSWSGGWTRVPAWSART
jgi:hypothetical protein